MQKTAFVEVMFRSFLTTLFIVVSLSSFAQQTATVYGRITDTDGKAIPYANVIAIDRNINAQSDVDGNYTIKIPANDCGSYVNNQPIDYHIQAIEDTEIIYFYLDDLKAIAEKSSVIERIGIKIAADFLNNHREHVTILMKFSPEERYKYLLTNKPELVQRISVTHLAQFLDISRETLSRMRARLAEQNIL